MIPKDLEAHKGVTIKKVNLLLKELGFQLRFTGYEPKYEFPTYSLYPIGRVTHRLPNNKWEVYALGDYTPEEWCIEILKRLHEYSKHYRRAAVERRRRYKINEAKRDAAVAEGKIVV